MTQKAMLPSDYVKKGLCSGTRYGIAEAIYAFLDFTTLRWGRARRRGYTATGEKLRASP